MALAESEKKSVPLYADFIVEANNDKETEQREHIDAPIERYGWCEETAYLMAVRSSVAVGQPGHDQLSQYKESLLSWLGPSGSDFESFANQMDN